MIFFKTSFVKHIMVVILTSIIALFLSLVTFQVPILNPIARGVKNFSVTDMFFTIQNNITKADTCQSIVIVDMTELHNRADIGELLNSIYDLKPKTIGVDLIFEGVKDDFEGNVVLEQAVNRISPISIFATKLTGYNKENKKFTGFTSSYFKDAINIQEGYVNLTDNMEKSMIRALSVERSTVFGKCKSFASFILEKSGCNTNAETDITINYSPVVYRVIPFDKVKENANYIKDKIVLVGAVNEEQDSHLTPLGKLSGIEIQARSIHTMMEHKSVIYIPTFLSIIIALLMCFVYELIISWIGQFVKSREIAMRTFLSESRIMLTIISLLYISSITILSFLLFDIFNIYIDMVIVLLMFSIVGFSHRVLFATINAYNYKKNSTKNNKR